MIPDGHEVLSVIDDKVITRTTENGKPIYYSITNGKAPERLSMDPSGYAINARDGVNRQLALADITAAQASGGGKAVLFIDVNNLGKVNYFRAGTQAGDEYLGEVARIIAEKTGGKGKVYRWGGDEFVVVLNETDKVKLRELNQTISDAVMSSPKLRAIFLAEKKTAANRYKELFPPHKEPSTINSYDELPASYKATLTPAEVAFARRDFSAFRTRVQEVDKAAIRDSAAIQPSISMGSAISNGRNADDVLAAADAQAARVKKDYKSALGCDDTKKYTGREAYLVADGVCLPRNLSAKPIALEPD
jgi:GGDEF domain-containing protein